jgi:DNA-binding transcriptional ArsR family regulator
MRMLRLRLGVDDLARLRFAPPTPYCELVVSAQVLQQPTSPLGRLWRKQQGHVPARARQLLACVPAHGVIPDFLAPEMCTSLDEALEVVRTTPTERLREELTETPWQYGSAAWARDLVRGSTDALNELCAAMRTYHDVVMGPVWPTIENAAMAELHRRAWQVATLGAAATLNTLHPRIRWHDQALEIDSPVDADVDLGGRGLRLMPSVWTRPGVALDWRHPTLVYPLPQLDLGLPDAGDDRLAAVLGSTRARVLSTLTSEHTTTELAHAIDISPASASMHAAALRDAGLVTTRRAGRAVRHIVTDLGQTMVHTAARGRWANRADVAHSG